MPMKSAKDVLAIEGKQEKLLYTKLLRKWGKNIGVGQFDLSLRLLGIFYRGIGVTINFIRDKGLYDEFEDYFIGLDGGYVDLFKVIAKFCNAVEWKLIPKFGA